jgi:hypothetical protein
VDCVREPTNRTNRYAVATVRGGTIIGHLPRKISKLYTLFMRNCGSIRCVVTGTRRFSLDLPQGGLEIPCHLLFEGKVKIIKKLKKRLKHRS